MATVARSSTSNLAIKTNAPEYFQCNTHCEGVLKRLRGREDLYDVVLVVGDSGKCISAHRLILIASSDYFSALLSGPMRESQEREVTLRDVDGDALEQLVNFCYTGTLELRVDTIESLLITANYLQLREVIEGCCEFLQRHLQPSNCLSVASFAERMNLETLLHNAKWTICENFEKISNHSEFFLLTAKQLGEFISSDDLSIPSEEFVFRVLMKWIEYEPGNRRKHFTDLLALVRLSLLSPTFLVEEVEPVCKVLESYKLFVNALKTHLPLTSNSTQAIRRSAAKHLLFIYLNTDQKLAIAGYNLQTKVWTPWSTPIEFCNDFAVAPMNDDLILVGGSLNGSPLNTVTSVNLRTMWSSKMAPLKTSRSEHRVAILNGLIYAMGGCGGRQALNSVERWDPESGTWTSVAPMKNARLEPGVAVMDGHLYVSGGRCGRDYLTSVECYDPVKNTWRSKAPMNVARTSHCLAPHRGYLLAIGGRNYGCNNGGIPTEIYDPRTDKWTTLAPHRGYLLAIGGRNYGCNNGGIPTEIYDPRTDKWTTIPCSHVIFGRTGCAARGPDLFINNESNIYIISSESSCDNLKLQIIANYRLISRFTSFELVVIGNDFRPGSWIG